MPHLEQQTHPSRRRVRRRHRQHINPLSAAMMHPTAPLRYRSACVTEVELGCGDGLFIVKRAEHFPDRQLIGLDIRNEFLQKGRTALAQRGIKNVQLVQCNLLVDLVHLFAPASIARFYINFPDPWFKRRARARRWLDEHALRCLFAALSPSGEVFYQSDVFEPTLAALALFEAHPRLENLAGDWRFYRTNPFLVKTSRERHCQLRQRDIWRLRFRKQKNPHTT